MGILTLSFLVLTPMIIWQCTPVHAAWDYGIKDAHCLSTPKLGYTNAAVNLATEVMIFILPMPVLRTLHVPRKKKMALCSIFSVGVMVIAIATARLSALSDVGMYHDFTYTQVTVYILSCAELGMAHICAAAPTFYQVLVWTKRKEYPIPEPVSVAMERRFPGNSSAPGPTHACRKINGGIYPGSMNLSDLAIMGRVWPLDDRNIEHSPSFSSHPDSSV
ncbi:hypothetical protein ETB97_005472 [Aspergillus alliaceus]|uniref:Rhodopsin domain-containing protein n=1 Tax=Petromyces alliaceus TaxID=209559 RepID=A0A8H5ZWL0_PETAA|nr:hypothetical protein ETB97_005472 [Aspergillus burnettii]